VCFSQAAIPAPVLTTIGQGRAYCQWQYRTPQKIASWYVTSHPRRMGENGSGSTSIVLRDDEAGDDDVARMGLGWKKQERVSQL
jgi:hypothetical protein